MSQEKGIFIVVSAPSGAGKTTICREFLKALPEISYSVSYTTRPARSGEENGKDYFFVSETEFRARVEAGDFAEWTEKFGCLYGTSIGMMREILSGGRDLLLDIDIVGAADLRKKFSEVIFVFILPPSLEELKRRLAGRGTETDEAIGIRLEKARDEIQQVFWYDYVIFNDEIDSAVNRLKSIYWAEKSKRERNIEYIREKFSLED
jgi:guanylate kinase